MKRCFLALIAVYLVGLSLYSIRSGLLDTVHSLLLVREESSMAEPEVDIPLQLPIEPSSALFGTVLQSLSSDGCAQIPELSDELVQWQDTNNDVRAIIDIPDLNLHEPVIQATESNTQWLRTNIYGEEDIAGAVFLDVRSNIETTPLKLVHGHNMKNGSMFANVPKMLRLENCAEAPVIYWTTDAGTSAYKVFSVLSVNSKEEALPIDYLDSFDDLSEILVDLLDRSLVPGGEISSYNCLLLNTCWYGKTGIEHNLHCIVVASQIGGEERGDA